MSAKATAIALEVLAARSKLAAWPVDYFIPLAQEYLELAKHKAIADLTGEHGRPMPQGLRESGPTHG